MTNKITPFLWFDHHGQARHQDAATGLRWEMTGAENIKMTAFATAREGG